MSMDFDSKYIAYCEWYCQYFGCEETFQRDKQEKGPFFELIDTGKIVSEAYRELVGSGVRVYVEDLSMAYEASDFPFLWLLVNAQFPDDLAIDLYFPEAISFTAEMVERELDCEINNGSSRLIHHNFNLFTEMFEVVFCGETSSIRYVRLVEKLLTMTHPNWFSVQRLAIWNLRFMTENLKRIAKSHQNSDVREELRGRIKKLA